MDIGNIGGSGRLPETSAARRATGTDAPDARPTGGVKGDRVDLTSEGQLARRALEEIRGMLASPDLEPVELRAIRNKLDERFYDHATVRDEIAERLGGLLDFA